MPSMPWPVTIPPESPIRVGSAFSGGAKKLILGILGLPRGLGEKLFLSSLGAALLAVIAFMWLRLNDSVGGNLWWWEGEGVGFHVVYNYVNLGIFMLSYWMFATVVFYLTMLVVRLVKRSFF